MSTYEDRVYDESRFIEDFSPTVCFLPGKSDLFKIMRACIGIEQVEMLWYNEMS